jgi:hypothetical protein
MDLEMAAEWGTPPWRLDEEAPILWVDRWVAYRNAMAARPKPLMGKGKGKRLI